MADALTTKATATKGMQALISAKAMQYYDKQRVFAGLIGPNNKYLVPKGAATIDVLQLDTMPLAAQTEATHLDAAETFATTARTLTPIVYTGEVITSWLKNDATANHFDHIAEASGYALALTQDSGNNATSFSGTYLEATASTHELGANSTALTAAIGRAGWQALMTSGARQPYNWVIDPIQAGELMRDAEVRQSLIKVQSDSSYAATTGVSMDRYLGTLHGVHIWVGNGMVESTGLFSIMFGQGALGLAYKLVDTPSSPTPVELNISTTWDDELIAYRTVAMACWHASGIVFTSTTNSFMCAIAS